MTFVYLTAVLVAFYLFIVAEFMLPSGGLLGASAVAMLIAAIVIAFSHSVLTGTLVLLLVLFTTPLVLMGMVRAWPHTPIGRRMLNRRPGESSEAVPRRTTLRGIPVEELIGTVGVAKSDLLPGGLVVIDGEKFHAVTTGMPIDAGVEVVVTRVELGRLHVREATDEDRLPQSQPLPQSPPSLEGPLESFEAE